MPNLQPPPYLDHHFATSVTDQAPGVAQKDPRGSITDIDLKLNDEEAQLIPSAERALDQVTQSSTPRSYIWFSTCCTYLCNTALLVRIRRIPAGHYYLLFWLTTTILLFASHIAFHDPDTHTNWLCKPGLMYPVLDESLKILPFTLLCSVWTIGLFSLINQLNRGWFFSYEGDQICFDVGGGIMAGLLVSLVMPVWSPLLEVPWPVCVGR